MVPDISTRRSRVRIWAGMEEEFGSTGASCNDCKDISMANSREYVSPIRADTVSKAGGGNRASRNVVGPVKVLKM